MESVFHGHKVRVLQTNSRVFLPKLGWMRYRNSRDILGVARNLAVSCVAGKWFASIQTAREVVNVIPVSASAVGIDVGFGRGGRGAEVCLLTTRQGGQCIPYPVWNLSLSESNNLLEFCFLGVRKG